MNKMKRRSMWNLIAACGMLLIVVGVMYVVGVIAHGLYVQDDMVMDQGGARIGDRSIGDKKTFPVATMGGGGLSIPEPATHQLREVASTFQSKLKSWSALYRHPLDSPNAPPRPQLYGNGRAVIPLLLTSTKYHGTSLFATTVQGWILKFLIPQGNIDLIVFYDVAKVPLAELLSILKLKKRDQTDPNARIAPELIVDVVLTEEEKSLLGDGYFLTSFHSTFALRVHPVRLPFPDYIMSNITILEQPGWMRCGCPPVCPQKRATVDYVQGTRWYTYDLFLQPIVHPYSFWIKLDVDIWLMRELKFNMVDTLVERGAIFAHTGYIYNGHGCSNELHKAIAEYLQREHMTAVSAGQRWWEQDDSVYYSNFVISSMAFHLSAPHMKLAKALTEYPTGFFKYRWTDQSLFHKVFGVFFGPNEADFLLDWTNLRCSKKAYRKGAVFYHSKGKKRSALLKQCTDI